MSLIASTPAAEEPAMIVPQIPAYKIELTEGSLLERKATVEVLQDIVKVETAKDREEAIAALGLAKGMLKKFVASKDELKEPALRICQKIDRLAKDYQDTVKVELARVEALTNAYQAKCNAAAEELRRQEMAEIAKQNAKAAQANDMEKLRENAAREAEINQPIKVEGAMMKQGLEYDILNALEAATAHPELFTIEPKRRELLAFINAPGFVSMPGVSTRLQVKVHAKAS